MNFRHLLASVIVCMLAVGALLTSPSAAMTGTHAEQGYQWGADHYDGTEPESYAMAATCLRGIAGRPVSEQDREAFLLACQDGMQDGPAK